jgi:alpha-mannosidase
MNNNNSLSIAKTILKLYQLTQTDVQTDWHYLDGDLSITSDKQAIDPAAWQPVQLNEKRYIIFGAGRQVRWLSQKFILPHHLQNYPLQGLCLRLALTWWAEDAQIFVDGKLVQQGDLFDSSARILLTRSATPQQEITVTIRLVSPGHDIGALMRSKLIYENTTPNFELRISNSIDPGFFADELTVLHKYLESFEPDKLNILDRFLDDIDWNNVTDAKKFDDSLRNLRQNLLPLAQNLKQRSLNLLGHAHLDMAWLWTSSETYEVGQRTFASVLNLQKEYPDLTFCHTSPALYAWIEENNPDLFVAIQNAVRQGKWEVVSGMWVEPEVNIISGESLVRQLLYGQKYCQEKFGAIAKVAWLPDSFGFTWQLPQICKQAGIEYFVTGKLHWNDTNKFPHGCFWWRSPDGTQIFTLMSPPNLTGVMDTNPIAMTDYAVAWETQTGLKDAFWLPGVGDHGGGPTRDMLEVQQRWQYSPFFPCIEFTTAIEYLEKISQQSYTTNHPLPVRAGLADNLSNSIDRLLTKPARTDYQFPIWNDELYLELHRGCYTTHADRKRFNRHCENLLYQAELFAAIASIVSKNSNRGWQEKIEAAWKKVLFNQFHDILPGTSIREVFVEADSLDKEAIAIGENILEKSLQAIASQIQLPPPPKPNAKPIVVFNSLNWSRSELVSLSILGEIYDENGNQLQTQIIDEQKLLFFAKDIPSVGYRLFWFCATEEVLEIDSSLLFRAEESCVRNLLPHSKGSAQRHREFAKKDVKQNFILENECVSVTVNSETGDLDSIYDKVNKKEILKGAGNQLQAFVDKGQYWDAWNIDPNYEQHPLPPTQLKSIEWVDNGNLQKRIRVVRQLNKSEFTQDYILQVNSPILKIETTVDWQEEHVMVKAAFPLNLESDYTTYEIPCGAIERSNNSNEPFQKAKWEVPALRWADLSDRQQEYGVSLLNDCKYGYDSKKDCLRLTLLRSPKWPDPEADRGIHQFTYALSPHSLSWQTAQTVRKGLELNVPLVGWSLPTLVFDYKENQTEKYLSTVGKFLDLQADNLVLMTLKFSNCNKQNLIMRCYECHGKTANLELESDLKLTVGDRVNLLEKPDSDPQNQTIQPWQIASFQLKKT